MSLEGEDVELEEAIATTKEITEVTWSGTLFFERYIAIMCKFGIGCFSTVTVISTSFMLNLVGVIEHANVSFT